ncbi:uncharacterized protein [Prorops nasuta]|uniref:uncharacterized protein n=1 Tax=Prorops nasuta TaxID=863751 RepID=UPI0034CE44F6
MGSKMRVQNKISFLRVMIIVLAALDDASSAVNEHRHPGNHFRRIHLPKGLEMSRKFACKEPQSRAYNLRDLMQRHHQNAGETANQPIYIVLKRCDLHSGCCRSPDMSCTPVESDVYFEDFEIEVWSLYNNDTRRQWIRVAQHGSCYCEETNANNRTQLEKENPQVLLIN